MTKSEFRRTVARRAVARALGFRISGCGSLSSRLLAATASLLIAGAIGDAPSLAQSSSGRPLFQWESLPPLPDQNGFAGSFAGVDSSALLVAGGANFPDRKPWEGGTKVWYDRVYVLEQPDAAWKIAGKLPRPLGYGVSITTKDGVACLGGSNAASHYADCFLLQWRGDELKSSPLPPLPRPCANLSGALVGNTIYVAGGIEEPTATSALNTFWSLDLANLNAGWQEPASWPGPGRMLATAVRKETPFICLAALR